MEHTTVTSSKNAVNSNSDGFESGTLRWPSRHERIVEYLQGLHSDERDVAGALADQFEKSSKPLSSITVFIPVAAHQESLHIYHTLGEYAKQTEQDFSVLLYLNCPSDNAQNSQAVLDEIERARADFPHLDVRTSELTSSDDKTIGQLRRELWHSGMLLAEREQAFAQNGEVLGINHDIDATYISPRYIERIKQYYKTQQRELDEIGYSECSLPARYTNLRHEAPVNQPNIARVLAWYDASITLYKHGPGFDAGLVVPLCDYVRAEGFDSSPIHEVSRLRPMGAQATVPGTHMRTSPRRFIERLQREQLTDVWTADSFGANDDCRNSETVNLPDIDYASAEGIIESTVPILMQCWMVPARIAAESLIEQMQAEEKPRQEIELKVERLFEQRRRTMFRFMRSERVRASIAAFTTAADVCSVSFPRTQAEIEIGWQESLRRHDDPNCSVSEQEVVIPRSAIIGQIEF